MATSDAQKKAKKKYLETEKGREAQINAVSKYQSTEQGKESIKAAQERFEATEKRKAYRREWDRKNRARLRKEKLNAEKSD